MHLNTLAFPLIYQKKFLWIFVLLSVAVLLALYIFQVNSLTGLAYHVADQEDIIQELQEGMAQLEGGVAQSIAYSDLAGLAHQLSFEKIDTITYIGILDGRVAQQNIQ